MADTVGCCAADGPPHVVDGHARDSRHGRRRRNGRPARGIHADSLAVLFDISVMHTNSREFGRFLTLHTTARPQAHKGCVDESVLRLLAVTSIATLTHQCHAPSLGRGRKVFQRCAPVHRCSAHVHTPWRETPVVASQASVLGDTQVLVYSRSWRSHSMMAAGLLSLALRHRAVFRQHESLRSVRH